MYEGEASKIEDAHVRVSYVDFAHCFQSLGEHDENLSKVRYCVFQCVVIMRVGRHAHPLAVVLQVGQSGRSICIYFDDCWPSSYRF